MTSYLHALKSNHPFRAFFEDNSILIQFILEEFIQSHQMMITMAGYFQTSATSPSTVDDDYSSLIGLLQRLIGHHPGRDQSSFPYASKGPLTKLKEYSHQFSLNLAHHHKCHVNLHSAANQAWFLAIDNLELLNHLKIQSLSPNGNPKPLLKRRKNPFNRLMRNLNHITQSIPQVMNAFSNNENVILCLLRKKKAFINIYGEDFLYKRFKWPKESSKLIDLLIVRYQSRGFETLLPTLIDLKKEDR